MSICYSVSAKPPEGEDFIMEQFETRSDADACYADLQTEGDDNIINAVPYPCVVITFEEFLGGRWLVTNRRLVVK